MNTYPVLLTNIRLFCLIAMVAVLSMGFVTPISVTQALLFNPLLLVTLMGIFAFTFNKSAAPLNSAEIHHLPGHKMVAQRLTDKAA